MRRNLIKFLILLLAISVIPGLIFAAGEKGEEKAEKEKIAKVALVLNQRRGDQSVIDAMCRGMNEANEKLDVDIKILESRDPTEFSDNIEAMVNWGAKLVFVSFQPLVNPAVDSAKKHPDVKYSLIYGMYDNPPKNVQCIVYTEDTASYIAGVMAGLKTKSGKTGFTTGADIPTQRSAYEGYEQGVHSVKPDAKTYYAVTGSFEDPAKGKEIALSLFSQGVDVICGWSAKCDWGVIEAAQEKGNWVCGLSGLEDLRGQYGKTIIGQAGVDFGATVYEIINDFIEGRWSGGGINERTIKTKDVGWLYEPTKDEGWTQSEINSLKKVYKDLIEGKIKIEHE